MEYCLVGMWREQTANSRVLTALPGMYMMSWGGGGGGAASSLVMLV